jgi:pimeloyl-ACP methyl ester carboxylesterase
MADDVARLLDRLQLRDVVLGGLSMGGYVVMAFLRRHPERVRAVVLADTKAGADPPAAAENRRRIADVLDAEGSARVLVDEVLPNLCGDTTRTERPEVYDEVRALVEAMSPAGAAWAQRAMAARPDSFDTLRSADLPALVVVGDEDGITPVTEAQPMAAALPRGETVVIQRSGHLSAVEAPEAFNLALRTFLGGLG